jgi:predicted dehydrogenase
MPIDAVLLGAGSRGWLAAGSYALRHPDQLRIVAVAEPDPERRARAAEGFELPPERVYERWEDALAAGRMAPALINTTMDRMHVDSTLAALAAGYDVLCEKPMAVSPHDCVRMVRAAEQSGRLLQICHNMRYSPFFEALKRTVDSGRLGQVLQIQHTEHVAFWHIAHSFVRGNWGNANRSAPMILAKCCHDMDLLVWLMGDRRCLRVSSFGHLSHFRPEAAPADAGQRCVDCATEADCPYSAVKHYLTDQPRWPVHAISVDPSPEARRRAVETGPYGRCVYHTDNTVVDHQAVLLEFEGDVLVNFTMHGFTHENERAIRIGGSHGDLRGHTHRGLVLNTFCPEQELPVEIELASGSHGGGDDRLMADFVANLTEPGREARTTARASLESHLLAFAAEESRLGGRVVDMDEYRARIEDEVAAAERATAATTA